MASVFGSISDAWKALLAVGGAIMFGIAVGVAASDAVGLPQDFDDLQDLHSQDMATLRVEIGELRGLVAQNQQGVREMVEAVNRLVCTMNAESQGRSTTVCQQIGRDP